MFGIMKSPDTRVELPLHHFEGKLAKELDRLKRQCDRYDAGEIEAADDMVATICLIALDKERARHPQPSLLTLLDRQVLVPRFEVPRSVGDCWNPYSSVAYSGGEEPAFWVPLLDGSPDTSTPLTVLSREDWWTSEVLFLGCDSYDDNGDVVGESLSRRELIETLRDVDRAHNDSRWPPLLWRAQEHFIAMVDQMGRRVETTNLSPVPAAVRHIAHELIRSLDPVYRRATVAKPGSPLLMIQFDFVPVGSPKDLKLKADRSAALAAAIAEPLGRRSRRRKRREG